MREILFRGKQKDNGEWVYGAYYHQTEFYGDDCDYHYIISSCDELEDNMMCFDGVIPETVGQYTGLTDKNGKKIFEGDVVKFTDSPFGYSYIGVVCFNEGSFCIKYEYWKKEKFHRIGQTDKWQDMGASGTVTYQYEILGNIHDNPELIESEDKK